MRGLALSTLVFVLALTDGACVPAQRTKATYCVAVDVHGDAETDLIARFDTFAAAHGLQSDKSSPVLVVYQNVADKSYDLDIRLSMADLGAIVTFFRYKPDAGNAVLKDLGRFVDNDIRKRWKITACKDIPGFYTPEAVR